MKLLNYQTYLNWQALQKVIDAPDPNNHGWVTDGRSLRIRWISGGTPPHGLFEHESCGCKLSKCSNDQCRCHRANVECTDLCTCQNCQNVDQSTAEVELMNDCSEEDSSDSDGWTVLSIYSGCLLYELGVYNQGRDFLTPTFMTISVYYHAFCQLIMVEKISLWNCSKVNGWAEVMLCNWIDRFWNCFKLLFEIAL